MNYSYLISLFLASFSLFANFPQSEKNNMEVPKSFVRYSEFGAKADGKTDDLTAIVKTHDFANKNDLSVKADDNAIYYIGGKDLTAIIQTDTDFGNASFIIDDREVENRNTPVFMVSSNLKVFQINDIFTLKKNQSKINTNLPTACLMSVTNSKIKRYIRFGPNQNNGADQTDIFIVDKNGNVDSNAPIIWDFDFISSITALPLDDKPLKIKGGVFTTIANKAASKYTYYNRGISIKRSNTIIDGLKHLVTGEGEQGAPYSGFLNISECANVTVKNSIFTGHKTYDTIGAAGVSVSMGTYDINLNRAINVSFENCTQTNDIKDKTYWGLMGSNYCKNLLLDRCIFSRFDAHMGVANATIRNSTLGHQGINAIGSGTFLVENSTIYGRHLINLRSDYGSTWQGQFIIRNCLFVPSAGNKANPSIIGGFNSGLHDFGYICYMPEKIILENIQIDDSNHPEIYSGPAIFANFNPEKTSDKFEEKYPYVITKEVHLKNIKTLSNNSLRISDNEYMFEKLRLESH
jgi:hypothetical protein